MHYSGPVYRHPLEAYTVLLQVTQGCSHNACTFCTMYKDVPFKVDDLSIVEEDLKEAKATYGQLERIFIENADPFVLSFEKLKTIGLLIRKYFPDIETISTYANIKNIKDKSIDELKELRELGYNDLYIGLETGHDPILKLMNKGYTAMEAYNELTKLNEAGIAFFTLLMLGVAGKGKGKENVEATIDLLNKVQPKMISVIPTGVFEGSHLEVLMNKGDYEEASEYEMLLEEKELLEGLKPFKCLFYGQHANNLVSVSGMLHKDKDRLIAAIDAGIKEFDPKTLHTTIKRNSL
jgi:radical SAM superfamily enzyme YgiQ (UPF0313 family)